MNDSNPQMNRKAGPNALFINPVRCFRHPTYNSKGAPRLDCSTCCELYISRIRYEKNQKVLEQTESNMEEMVEQVSIRTSGIGITTETETETGATE